MGFVGIIPDDDTTPDRAVGVMPTPGKRQGRILSGTKEVIESHGVQVRVRSLDFPGGHTKSKAIADKLDATNRDVPVTIGGSVYKITSIVRGSVMHVGMDPDNRQRHNFTINMQVKLEED
jgi:hypothetical protein